MSSASPLFCTRDVPSAQQSVRQAELCVQRWGQPCVQSQHLEDSQDSNQKTFLIYSAFNPTICNDSRQIKWLFRVAFKPYNDNILQVWPWQKRRETFSPANLGGCVGKSLCKGMSNSVFVNHESTHTIHKLKTEYKWWFYYHSFWHYYSKDNRQQNHKIFFIIHFWILLHFPDYFV